ncbi:MAG: DUF1524 domain-containing protein [Chloroflexi bacterium]|nr:DUF1524 domain-containing protein [Chloroflexota bacterium]
MRLAIVAFVNAALVLAGGLAPAASAAESSYRGLVVAPEHRCSPYDPDDYPYPQSVEPAIVAGLDGRVYGPYTGTCFADRSQTDIEHIVARSEAHDSGLCARDAATRAAFARDVLNLTLAAPSVNRHQKSGHDVAEWTPALNACWFADRTIQVRRKYGLTIDRREAEAVERVLTDCASTAMAVSCAATASPPDRSPVSTSGPGDPLVLYDDNGNGRITCAEARRHGIAPVPRDHPAYAFMRDGDGDGVVCE